jgi:hypothetical protein
MENSSECRLGAYYYFTMARRFWRLNEAKPWTGERSVPSDSRIGSSRDLNPSFTFPSAEALG